jgi:hypothetical protein
MRQRRIAACAAVVGVAAGLVGLPSAPAVAQVPTDHTIVAGNFAGGPRDEQFYYTPGSGPDFIAAFSVVNDEATVQVLGSISVSGTYTPLVGDYDADGFDEILWYAPGIAADYMWNFVGYSSVDVTRLSINGTYRRPAVGDFTGDGAHDILWYNPGFGADYLWEYNPGGTFTSKRSDVNGTYLPVAGSFGGDRTDDLFWYSPGTAADYLWDYTPGSTAFQSTRYAVNRTTYRPFSLDIWREGRGNEDILWYAPGLASDGVWDWFLGALYTYGTSGYATDGEFLTAAGNFLGDGRNDVVFDNNAETVFREHRPLPDGGILVIDYLFTPTPTAADARVATEGGDVGVSFGPGVKVSETTISR